MLECLPGTERAQAAPGSLASDKLPKLHRYLVTAAPEETRDAGTGRAGNIFQLESVVIGDELGGRAGRVS